MQQRQKALTTSSLSDIWGIDDQSKPWTSREVIANTTGLNAFIDGHSHSTVASEAVKDKDGKEVTLSQTGTKLAAIGELIITADGKISTSLVTDYAAKKMKRLRL